MAKIEKIYELTTIGYEKVIKEFTEVNSALKTISETKERLNKQKLDATGDIKQIREYNKALKEQGDQEAVLKAKKKELMAELKAYEAQQKQATAASKLATEASKEEVKASEAIAASTRKERIERAQLNLEKAKELQAKIEPTTNENLNQTNKLLGEQRVKLFELQLEKEKATKSRNTREELEGIRNITQAIEIQTKAVEKLTNIRDGFIAEANRPVRPTTSTTSTTTPKRDTTEIDKENAALRQKKILAAEAEVELARLNRTGYKPTGIESLDKINAKLLEEKEKLAGVTLERERYNRTGNKEQDINALNNFNRAIDIQKSKIAGVVAERARLATVLKIDQVQAISNAGTDRDVANLRRSQDAAKANRLELKELEAQKLRTEKATLSSTGNAQLDDVNRRLIEERLNLKELEIQKTKLDEKSKNNSEVLQLRQTNSAITAQTALVRELITERQLLINQAKLSGAPTSTTTSSADVAAIKAVNDQIGIQRVLLAEANLERVKAQIASSPVSQVAAIKTINDAINTEKVKIAELQVEKAKLAAAPVISDVDAARIREINVLLADEKLKVIELRVERQNLLNELKSEAIASKASIAASQERISENQAEAGSYRDLINKRKELLDLLERRNPVGGGGGGRIPPGTPPPAGAAEEGPERFDFRGELITFQQGVAQLRQYETEAGKLKETINGVGLETNTLNEKQQHLGAIGAKVNESLSNGFANMKGQLSQMIFMYTGWFAAFQEAGKIISENAKLSDSFADLQIRIKGSGDEVQTLFNHLKEIDTRTSLTGLVDIANVISKKGVQKEEIAGLTESFDRLNVVLGHEIGEPQAAVANIIKLITIFNDDKHVTKQRVDEIGTSLFKLTTSGVATGEFLVNFAERVGAVRGITGLTLPNVLGLGAALQQLGQRTEVAGTAAVQLTTKIFSDVPKFAKAAGISIDEFRKKLETNPFEALISVAEGLKNIKDDELATQFEDVVKAFDEMGIRGARIKAVLGDIGTNAQFVRDKMALAAVGTKDYGNQTAAADLKQNTFAANLDKIRKALESLGTDRGVQVVLSAVAQVILFLVNSLNIILPLIVGYGVVWGIANSSMLIARASVLLINAQFVIQYAWLLITTTATRAYAATIGILTGNITRVVAAMRAWLVVASTTELVLAGLLTGMVAVYAAAVFLAVAMRGQTDALKEKNKEQLIDLEITLKANQATAEQITNLRSLVDAILSVNTSYDTQLVLFNKLVESNQKFAGAMKDGVIQAEALRDILAEVTDQINLQARAQAAAEFTTEKFKKVLEVQSIRQKFETELSLAKINSEGQREFDLKDIDGPRAELAQDLIDKISFHTLKGSGTLSGAKADMVVDGVPVNSKEFFGLLKERATDVFREYAAYANKSGELQEQIAEQEAKDKAAEEKLKSLTLTERIQKAKDNPFSLGEKEYDQLIKDIVSAREVLKYGDKQIKLYNDDIERFQKILDEIRNKKLKGRNPRDRGARLTGDEKDMLAEIEAQMQLELALAEGEFARVHEIRQATYYEEINYTDQIAAIHKKYTQQKIDYLESLKKLDANELAQVASARKEIIEINKKLGTNISIEEKLNLIAHRKELEDIVISSQRNMNAKERLVYAQQQKELSDIETKRIKDDQAIRDREFNRQRGELDRGLTNQVNNIKLRDTEVQEDPTIPATVRAEHKLASDREILALQEDFNKKMDKLEIDFKQKSDENLKKGLDTKRDIVKDTIAVFNSQIKDAQDAGQKLRDEFETRAANQITEILKAGGGAGAAARQIRQIQQQLAIELAQAQIAEDRIQIDLYEKGLKSKLTSEKEYLAAKKKLAKDENDVTRATVDKDISEWERLKRAFKDLGNSLLENVLHIKQYTQAEKDSGKQREDAVKESEAKISQAINEAYNGYFEREQQRIDQEKENAQTRNDLLFDQRKARAQSQDEEDSLERQRIAENKKLDKEAAEEKKKLALKKLAIDFALAAGIAMATYPFPLFLLPIAAATALYFVQKANINAQQFAKGGAISKAPTSTGGDVIGQSHRNGGVKFNYEAEDEELMIINKKSAKDTSVYEVKGTIREIASAINVQGGGVAFSPGRTAKRSFADGGILGTNFTAPKFTPTPANGQDNAQLVAAVLKLAEETSNRIDRIEVNLDTQNLQREQGKQVKLNQIGSL